MIGKFISLVLFFWLISVSLVAAQNNTSLGVANYLPIVDSEVSNGQIVSSTKDGFVITKGSYNQSMIGVITEKPAISFDSESTTDSNKYAVLSSGNVYVKVSKENGNISKGDFITSASQAGIGMKADKSGFVTGSALEDVVFSNKDDIKEVYTSLDIHYLSTVRTTQSSLGDVVSLSTMATYESPLQVFRYVVAALVVLVSVVISFLSFGRLATLGIEALGRNPLASRKIQFGIVANVMFSLVIVVTGLLVAYFVIKL